MIVHVGAVYQNEDKVKFVAVLESCNEEKRRVNFRLVNLKNWSMLARMTGELMANGNINCRKLAECKMLARSVRSFYRGEKDVD